MKSNADRVPDSYLHISKHPPISYIKVAQPATIGSRE